MSNNALTLIAMLLPLPTLLGCMGHSPSLDDEVKLIESYGGFISVGWSPERVSFFDHVRPIPVNDEDFKKIVSALAEFKNLKALNMKETDVTDKSLPLMATLGTLERINLVGTEVTREGILKLLELPKLSLVELSRDRFSEEDVRGLRQGRLGCSSSESKNPSRTSDGERIRTRPTVATQAPLS